MGLAVSLRYRVTGIGTVCTEEDASTGTAWSHASNRCIVVASYHLLLSQYRILKPALLNLIGVFVGI